MPLSPLLMMMAALAPDAGLSGPVAWSVIAEGPIEQVTLAKAEATRCRFSRLDVVATRGGQGQLRVPAGEMLPRRAICINNVADTLTGPPLKWFGADLRKY